jgi:hypothetical protein
MSGKKSFGVLQPDALNTGTLPIDYQQSVAQFLESTKPGGFLFVMRGDRRGNEPESMSWCSDVRSAYALAAALERHADEIRARADAGREVLARSRLN